MPAAPTQPDPELGSPASTAPDASETVLRVLARSRGTPVMARVVGDVARAAAAIAIGVLAWGRLRPPLATLIDRALASWARDLLLAAAPLLLGALLMTLLCRVGARRFVHPLRRRPR